MVVGNEFHSVKWIHGKVFILERILHAELHQLLRWITLPGQVRIPLLS